MYTANNRFLITLGITALLIFSAWNPARAAKPMHLVCDIWPPYQIQTNRGVIGFSARLITAIYERLDLPAPDVQDYPWKRALHILKSGDADGLFSANHTPAREQYAHYPEEPLIESPWVIWSLGGTPIKSLDDLKGLTIGVVSGYSYTKEFWAFIRENCVVDEAVSDEGNFKKLALGRIDAIAAEYGNGLHLIHDLGLPEIKPHKQFEIKRDGLFIMFSRENVTADFVGRFSRELKAFKQTVEFETLYAEYFGTMTSGNGPPKCKEPFSVIPGSAQ